jgi:hypothetical protein
MKLIRQYTLRSVVRGDESGAILVLALIFMVVAALLITGLAAWESNDINNIGTLKSDRTTLYAADGAIQVAIANTRYVYPSTTTPGFCPNPKGPSTDPFTVDGQSINVWCAQSVNPTNCPISACTRIETLSAFPQSQCMTTPCSGNPYVLAEVIFDDNTSASSGSSFNDCNLSGAKTTCGSTMTVYSYTVGGSTS